MSRRALALSWVVLAPAAASQEPASRAFVEVTASTSEPFVGEALELRLRFGFESDVLANHLVPLFARELELPVQVEWEPERGGDALTWRDDGAAPAGGRRFALGDSVARAQPVGASVRDGRTFETFELVRRATAARAAALELPAASLRFAYAARIEDDLIRGRVAVDREVVRVLGAPLALNVRPLPEAGRPVEFTGAVGRRQVAATAEPTALTAGESVRLTLTIEGEGDPAAFGAPDLAHLEGFVQRGVLDGHDARVRRLVYDLAPVDERVAAIPSIGFAWFSSDAPVGYVVERTAPIALSVAPRPSRGGAAPPPPTPAKRTKSSSRFLPFFAAFVAIAAALIAARRQSARRAAEARAGSDPRATAAARFRARLLEPDADAGAAFVDYLAARVGVAPAAVVTPDLAARLERRGVPRELAAEVAARLAARIAARYAGGASAARVDRSGDAAELARYVERLDSLDFGPPPAAAAPPPPPR